MKDKLKCIVCESSLTGNQVKFCGRKCTARHHQKIHYRKNKKYYKEYNDKYYKKNSEELREYTRNHYIKYREKKAKLWKESYEANPEKYKEIARKSYYKNRETRVKRASQYYQENKERLNAWKRAWSKRNKKHIAEKKRKWTQENKELCQSYKRKRKAKKLNALLQDTDDVAVREIYAERNRLFSETGVEHHVDHIIPLSIGGAHHQDNLRIIPAEENLSKGDKYTPELGGVWADNELAKATKEKLGII